MSYTGTVICTEMGNRFIVSKHTRDAVLRLYMHSYLLWVDSSGVEDPFNVILANIS